MNDFYIAPIPGTEADLIVDEVEALDPNMWISPRGEDLGEIGVSCNVAAYDAEPESPGERNPGLIWTYVRAGEWIAAYDQAA